MTAERLDHFMARANAAYYAARDPFADFTTAPEISQVFGEVLGLWAAVTWGLLGSPAAIALVEAGPGRGTLMADARRAIARAAPAFHAAASVHLIETSPRLRAAQREKLGEVAWHDTLDTVPEGPFLLLANEFLDALPIRQFVRRGTGWTERFAGPDGFVERATAFDPGTDGLGTDGLGMNRPGIDGPGIDGLGINRSGIDGPGIDGLGMNAAEGAVAERCEPAEAFAAQIAARLNRHTGAALLLDYGPETSALGDSLQAIAEGRPVDPSRAPGTADLTAHVDFARFGAVARRAGAAVHGPVPQGVFLARLGLAQRTNQLARHQPPGRAAALMEGARRLMEPDRMGRLFKAIVLTSPGIGTPPGLA